MKKSWNSEALFPTVSAAPVWRQLCCKLAPNWRQLAPVDNLDKKKVEFHTKTFFSQNIIVSYIKVFCTLTSLVNVSELIGRSVGSRFKATGYIDDDRTDDLYIGILYICFAVDLRARGTCLGHGTTSLCVLEQQEVTIRSQTAKYTVNRQCVLVTGKVFSGEIFTDFVFIFLYFEI